MYLSMCIIQSSLERTYSREIERIRYAYLCVCVCVCVCIGGVCEEREGDWKEMAHSMVGTGKSKIQPILKVVFLTYSQ